ncbi:MAG: hypothetical protein V1809_13530 [Planctomycetota bacterium]
MTSPRSVRKYRPPAYPTRLEILKSPTLLERHVPAAWVKCPEIAGAMAVFLAANLTSCGKNESPGKTGMAKARGSIVAPIFEHGEGRGGTGCVVVNPPVFMSEEEAMQVIQEELKSAGVELIDKEFVFKDVILPLPKFSRDEYIRVKQGKHERVRNHVGYEPFASDKQDVSGRIAVEYVSQWDNFRLGEPLSRGTAEGYDLPKVARSVLNQVKAKGVPGIYFGMFYDPLVRLDEGKRNELLSQMKDGGPEKYWVEARKAAAPEFKRLLRLQVKDFVDWLKAQGAI